MIIQHYRNISMFLHPFVWCWLHWRLKKGKEDKERLNERFGKSSLPRPQGKLAWIHAASVGEVNSAIPLLESLHEHFPELNILVTTGTVTSARVIRKRLPERAYHQYVPVDTPNAVKGFLKHWQPDLAVFTESELWPNMVFLTKQQGIPMLLINARISDRSHKRWRHFRSSFLAMMACFTEVFAGSAEDKRRLTNLGVTKAKSIPNLKFDARPLPADPKVTSDILSKIGDRRIWVAASTHPGEELFIADAHLMIKETFPDILTIMVPRHAHRGEEIVPQLAARKLIVSCRSKEQVILPETDIYVADTMGELGIFYRLSGIVFIGGSLIPHGGHNPIEAAQLDCAILCGQHMENFRGICRELQEANAMIMVQSIQDLADRVVDLLRDHDKQEKLAETAHRTVELHQGAVAKIVPVIADLLELPLMTDDDASEASSEEEHEE